MWIKGHVAGLSLIVSVVRLCLSLVAFILQRGPILPFMRKKVK